MRYPLAVTIVLLLVACGTPDSGMKYATSTVPSATGLAAPPTQPPASPGAASQIPGTVTATKAVSGFGEYTDAKGNRILGSPNAPVTLTDYSDFL